MSSIKEHESILGYLEEHVTNFPSHLAYCFLSQGGKKETRLTYIQLQNRTRAIASRVQAICKRGDRVLLLFSDGLEMITGFLGCLQAGAVAVPLELPKVGGSLEFASSVGADTEANLVLTSREVQERLSKLPNADQRLQRIPWINTDQVEDEEATGFVANLIPGESLAFLQYTSGSTGRPHGVMVTHKNLLHNQLLIAAGFGFNAESVCACWMPTFHTLGLVVHVLASLYHRVPCYLMSRHDFTQNPFSWLELISRKRVTISGGPNFAYELCVSRVGDEETKNLDLSCWKTAICGGEAVKATTIDRFFKKFRSCGFRKEAFHSSFGLSEATGFATGYGPVRVPTILHLERAELLESRVVHRNPSNANVISLVGNGMAMLDEALLIVDPETRTPCEPCKIGEVWLRSPSVSGGYWRNPSDTEQVFQGFLASNQEGPYLRTGNLGFLENSELFLCGRLSDFVIVRGRNIHLRDVEECAEKSHPTIKTNGTAAFCIEKDGEEHIALVCEVTKKYQSDWDEAIESVYNTTARELEVTIWGVALVESGTIPRTPTGKIQRFAARSAFLEHSLSELKRWTRKEDTQRPKDYGSHPAIVQRRVEDGLLWEYELSWRRRYLLEQTKLHEGSIITWWIVGGEESLRNNLAEELRRVGFICQMLSLENEDNEKSFARLLWAVEENANQSAIICLVPNSLEERTPGQGADRIINFYKLVQELNLKADRIEILAFITRGGCSAPERQEVLPFHSSVVGMANTIHLEFPILNMRVIDLEPHLSDSEASQVLAKELLLEKDAFLLAISNENRYVPVLEERASCMMTYPALREGNDVMTLEQLIEPTKSYLVYAPFDERGKFVAQWLLKMGVKKLYLVCYEEVLDPSTRASLVAQGVEVISAPDIEQDGERFMAQVAKVVQNASIQGVFALPQIILGDDWESGYRPGLALLLKHFGDLQKQFSSSSLDFWISFSSAASILGAPGLGTFTALNACADGLAFSCRSFSRMVWTLHWGSWQTTDTDLENDVPNVETSHSISFLDPTKALERLGSLRKNEFLQRLILPFDLKSLLRFFPEADTRENTIFSELRTDSLEWDSPEPITYQRRLNERELVEPRNELEGTLASIFRSTLRINRVGIRDSFSDLGGDSLLTVELLIQINKRFGLDIRLSEYTDVVTVEAIAHHIEVILEGKRKSSDAFLALSLLNGESVDREDLMFKILDASDVSEAASCLCNALAREPMSRTCQLTQDYLMPVMEFFCQDAATKGMSIIVRDRESKEVVAVGLVEDYQDWLNGDSFPPRPEILPILSLMTELDEKYAQVRNIAKSSIFHLNLAGVREGYEGFLLSPKLVEISLDLAKKKGFDLVVGHISAESLQHLLCSQYGFNEMARVNYQDFCYEGRKVFASIHSPEATILLERSLKDWRLHVS